MVINKISIKGNKAVSFLLDDDSEIIIHYEVFVKSGLRKGDQLSDAYIIFLLRNHKKQLAKEAALRVLSRRMHSVKELELKLKQKKYEVDVIHSVIEDLQTLNFLDDSRFAEMYTEEMFKHKKFGTNKIKYALLKRGIKDDIINKVILKYLPENSFENAFYLTQKKYALLKKRNLEKISIKLKLESFLYSKGYDFDTIKKVIAELLSSKSFKED